MTPADPATHPLPAEKAHALTSPVTPADGRTPRPPATRPTTTEHPTPTPAHAIMPALPVRPLPPEADGRPHRPGSGGTLMSPAGPVPGAGRGTRQTAEDLRTPVAPASAPAVPPPAAGNATAQGAEEPL